jgi:hypothetical protein
LDSQPETPQKSTLPDSKAPAEEPVPAVTTRETIPVWARTVPVVPEAEGADSMSTAGEGEPLPAKPMQKGDPDWTEAGSPVDAAATTEPSTAVPMQKPAPAWAQTVPQPEGEGPAAAAPTTADMTETPRAVASDSVNKTWPPAEENSTAPPAETDIWPPEPPTEKAMPAWPPSSQITDPGIPSDIPETVIPSWPDSFDAASATTPPPAAPAKTRPATTPPAATTKPATAPPKTARAGAQPATVPPASASKPATAPVETTASAPAQTTAPASPASTAPIEPSPAAAGAQPPAAPTEPVTHAKPISSGYAWAPSPPSAAPEVDWPSPVEIPSWAPRIHIGPDSVTPAAQGPAPAAPASEPPAPGPQSAAQVPAPAPAAPAPPASSHPPAAPNPPAARRPGPAGPAAPASTKSSWEVVQQQRKAEPAKFAPTPEDRSYAEWFAWAKRGGAPASACHAAAQGAFQALASGKDVATAVQWATAAMSRPPAAVPASRQTYCAWFSLAHIDLNLDQHRAHAFAAAAVAALDGGADAATAHASGLAAAGIR